MIVVGLGFGDEGKGLVTSWLCSKVKNPIVVRFNGGHQAGHTVVYNGKRHVFSNFGSGSLQDVPTYWSKYCTFDPVGALNELRVLNKNLSLFVDPDCPVVTPFDKIHNQAKERCNNHGSVGVGFGSTIERQEAYYKLHVRDFYYQEILFEKIKSIAEYYEQRDDSIECIKFIEDIFIIRNKIRLHNDLILNDYNPIFEGAQGIMLDQDYGIFPNVTRSNTTTKNALKMDRDNEIFYVTRSYQTRHGNGWMPNNGAFIKLINKMKKYVENINKDKIDLYYIKIIKTSKDIYNHEINFHSDTKKPINIIFIKANFGFRH